MKANTARKVKGTAMDKLRKLGFENVYASDSGNPTVIVSGGKEKLTELKRIFNRVTFFKGQALITFGKKNTEILENL